MAYKNSSRRQGSQHRNGGAAEGGCVSGIEPRRTRRKGRRGIADCRLMVSDFQGGRRRHGTRERFDSAGSTVTFGGRPGRASLANGCVAERGSVSTEREHGDVKRAPLPSPRSLRFFHPRRPQKNHGNDSSLPSNKQQAFVPLGGFPRCRNPKFSSPETYPRSTTKTGERLRTFQLFSFSAFQLFPPRPPGNSRFR